MPRGHRLFLLSLLIWATLCAAVSAGPFIPKSTSQEQTSPAQTDTTEAGTESAAPADSPAQDEAAPPAEPAAQPAATESAANATLAPSGPGSGSLTYRARVVHNDRQYISIVSGSVDYARQAMEERVEESYLINWKRLNGGLTATHPMLPALWQVGAETAHRFGGSMPHFENPRLRHFLVADVIAGPGRIVHGAKFLDDQLVIETATFDPGGFEIVAQFRGAPLVIVGSGTRHDEGYYELQDMVVLGPQHELYQYFFDEISYSPVALAQAPVLPQVNFADYVTFPPEGGTPVAIRPVKDWLVFQATLPDGRPLNLVFDSGAETMILDDMVLKLDAKLNPVGRVVVAGALELGEMELYEGLSFDVGGVKFDNLTVLGAPMTSLGFGADLRIHGIVGSEILQLCQLDLDLNNGQLKLMALGAQRPNGAEELPLTFIQELPHVEANVHDTGRALLLLDTGQRKGLSVNWDWLESYEMDDELRMDGFLGDVTGSFLPNYIVEELNLSLAGQTYTEKIVSAGPESTFMFDGLPVVGSIGFPLLARHFGGITFDYSLRRVFLRDPAEERVFTGRPEAWDKAGEPFNWKVTTTREPAVPGAGTAPEDINIDNPDAAANDDPAVDTRRPELLPESPGEGDDPRQNYSWFEYWERRNAREAEDNATGEPLGDNSTSGAGDYAADLGNALETQLPALAAPTESVTNTAVASGQFAELAGRIRGGHGAVARRLLAVPAETPPDEDSLPSVTQQDTPAEGPRQGREFKKGLPKLKFR